MAHEAENEAKQLDSVTDRQEEKDFDESKAAEAMSALTSAADTKAGESDGNTVKVSKEDVAVIVKELEVTEDEAKAALRLPRSGRDNQPWLPHFEVLSSHKYISTK